MFKLYRDSLFNPKNIIHYRAKKLWFVILFMLLISIPYILATISLTFNFNGIDYFDRENLQKGFSETNASIVNYNYEADKSFVVGIGNYNVLFLSDNDELSSITKSYDISFFVSDDTLYYYLYTPLKGLTFKISTVEKLLGDNYKNCSLKSMNTSNNFYQAFDNVCLEFKPAFMIAYGIEGLIGSIFNILFYSLLGYIFLNLSINAKNYMKKGQLYKMLIFSSNGLIIAESLTILFNISGILSFLLIIIGFTPYYRLEREFINRIRVQKFGEQVLNDKTVIDKINDMIKNKKDEDDNDSEE